MKIGRDFDIIGKIVKNDDTYTVIDNNVLTRTVVSSTLLRPGKSTRGHEHKGQEEVYIFIRGKGVMVLGESNFKVEGGDVIIVRDGEFHRVINPSDEDIYFVCVFEGKRNH